MQTLLLIRRYRQTHLIIVATCILFLLCSGTISAQVRGPLPKLPYQKLDARLARMTVSVDSGLERGLAVRTLANPLAQSDRVPVTVRTSDLDGLSTWLVAAGARIANSAPGVIEAYVTPEHLRALNSLAIVSRVSEILPPMETALSQAVFGHNAINWHGNGYSGLGVKVGVIDTGFIGYGALMGVELPGSVIARCYTSIGSYSSDLAACQTRSQHGTAVTESLADIAPGVQLYISNPKSHLDFRQAVDWMTAQGVRVINYSASDLWDGPGDGTSPYSDSPLRTVDSAVNGGAVFVAAAGNEGYATYLGGFVDTDGDSWAEFPAGLDDNLVFLLAGETVHIQLRWQDDWGTSTRDIDLALFNSGGTLVDSSTAVQNGSLGSEPFEFISYTAVSTGWYYIGVHRYAGSIPAWIQLQNVSSQQLEYYTHYGSIGSPAETANAGALAVGAAPWYSPTTLEAFSSRGPTPDGRVKPDVVGLDRADTATYGSSAFAGTSQASPHVAGLAALVIQAFPSYSPTDIASYLKAYATPGAGPRPNSDWGFGMPVLPLICGYAISPTSVRIPRAGGTGTISVQTIVGCPWRAEPLTGGITIVGAASGFGDGTVTYVVAPSEAPQPRSLEIRIASHLFSATQAGTVVPPLDLNDDGRLDLLWQHQGDGRLAGWLMNGTHLVDGTLLTPGQVADTSWKLAGAGDLDGDGHTDLVWQNTADGRTAAWLMDGLVQRQGTLFSIPVVPDTNWRIRSVGDLNGDGRADLFWQHDGDGRIAVWLMDGLTVMEGTLFSPGQVPDVDWKIVGTADFDRNGSRDLVWHHQVDGRIAVWLMNGTSLIRGVATNPGSVPDTNWKIKAVGDLNMDGDPDLIWQNSADGRIAAWFLRGLDLIDGTLLTPSEVPDTDWHIVGPK